MSTPLKTGRFIIVLLQENRTIKTQGIYLKNNKNIVLVVLQINTPTNNKVKINKLIYYLANFPMERRRVTPNEPKSQIKEWGILKTFDTK